MAIREVLKEKPVVHVLFVLYVKNVNEVCLYMNVGTKPSMSVCYICAYTLHVKYDLQCQDNQFDIIKYHCQESCDDDDDDD